MKPHVDALALFGGPPLFASIRTNGQLAQPDSEVFFSHARTIFEGRRLTNNGPLVRQLEARLAELHQVEHCVSFCNASVGLVLLLRCLGGEQGGEILLPTFTYPGLPHIVRWAGFAPRFCDVDPLLHSLDPASAASRVSAATRAILAVHQVQSPCRIAELEDLARRLGVPLVFDSVHVLGNTWQGRPLGGFGAAEVFSLHATKLLNGFEGGYATTDNPALADSLRSARSFGFQGKDNVAGLGLNGKLNEIHAALALASLDGLDATMAANTARYEAYLRHFSPIPGLRVLEFAPGERHNHQLVMVEVLEGWPLTRDDTVRLLRAENALARPYYSPPLHSSEHCPAALRGERLPVAEDLSERFIQMPVGDLTSVEDIAALAGLMDFVAANGRDVAARLAQAGAA